MDDSTTQKQKNKDFLLAAEYFKSHGMKDWYFPLEIKDLGLINIIENGSIKDTKKKKNRIIEECKNNFWFYSLKSQNHIVRFICRNGKGTWNG